MLTRQRGCVSGGVSFVLGRPTWRAQTAVAAHLYDGTDNPFLLEGCDVPVGLAVAASAQDMDLLISAASSLQEVKISERRPLDTAGDGLAFPLDAGLALQALEVAGAVAGSVEAMRLLLEAWRKVRSKRSGDSADTSSQIFICNLRTGEVMYSGDQLDAAVIDAVLSKVEKGSRD